MMREQTQSESTYRQPEEAHASLSQVVLEPFDGIKSNDLRFGSSKIKRIRFSVAVAITNTFSTPSGEFHTRSIDVG